ncbi:quinon protein alcohol dehydrogenase-like superfamily [Baffinella frigidus]|nr:quinon protein alcohol dehydrogenase-like superfamily [Cryptophyta sp. CCMP2293]
MHDSVDFPDFIDFGDDGLCSSWTTTPVMNVNKISDGSEVLSGPRRRVSGCGEHLQTATRVTDTKPWRRASVTPQSDCSYSLMRECVRGPPVFHRVLSDDSEQSAADTDPSNEVIDAATGEERWKVRGHPFSRHTAVAISPSGRYVASATLLGRQWKLWDSLGGALRMEVPAHDGTGECSCGNDGQVADSCLVSPLNGLLSLQFSPCGDFVACGCSEGELYLWDLRGDACRLEWRLSTGARELSTLSFSSDGALIACGGFQDKTWVVSVATGTLLHSWTASAGGAICPTDNNLLATGTEFAVSLWDLDTQKLQWEFTAGHSLEENANFAVWSPSGDTVATVDQPSVDSDDDDVDLDDEETWYPPHVKLMDATTGEVRKTLPHAVYSNIRGAVFAPGGGQIITVIPPARTLNLELPMSSSNS